VEGELPTTAIFKDSTKRKLLGVGFVVKFVGFA
jgi:hypothetical protein